MQTVRRVLAGTEVPGILYPHPKNGYEESVFTAIPSVTGLPAMVTDGIQLIADSFKESTLLSIAHSVEKEEA